MQAVVNNQEEGVTGHISRKFNSIIIQATPDYNISGSMFLPKTNSHPLSAWKTTALPKETCTRPFNAISPYVSVGDNV